MVLEVVKTKLGDVEAYSIVDTKEDNNSKESISLKDLLYSVEEGESKDFIILKDNVRFDVYIPSDEVTPISVDKMDKKGNIIESKEFEYIDDIIPYIKENI